MEPDVALQTVEKHSTSTPPTWSSRCAWESRVTEGGIHAMFTSVNSPPSQIEHYLLSHPTKRQSLRNLQLLNVHFDPFQEHILQSIVQSGC